MKQNLRFFLLTLLCAVCSVVWGAEAERTVTMQYSGGTTTNMTGENDAALVGLNNEKWSVVGYKGGASYYPGLNKDGTIRLYYSQSGNNTIEIRSLENNTISSISITYSGDNNNGYVEVGGTRVTPTDGVYTINSTSFVVGSANEVSAQVHIKTIVINYISEKEEIAVPTFSPAGGTYSEAQTVTISCATEGATIYYTLDGTEPNVNSDEYKSSITIEETTTIKAIAVKGEESSGIVSATYTIEQQVPAKPATLPFEFDGGRADIENTDGLTQNGLGSDYTSSPKLKFDGTGDWLLLQFDERPGVLTFDIKGNGFSGGSFTVQTSEDGETFTDLETYTELGSTQSEEFPTLGENVRYIKWVYTEKSNGNVALGNITLAKYVEPEKYTLTISDVENATISATGADGNAIASGSEVLSGTEVTLTIETAEGYELDAVSVTKADGSDVSVTENATDGSWSFTMPASNVTVTCTVKEEATYTGTIYEKITSVEDLAFGEKYLIVYEDGSLVFDGSLETLDASKNSIPVTIENNQIRGTEAIDAATFFIDPINDDTGSDAFLIFNNQYYFIYQNSDQNGLLVYDPNTNLDDISVLGNSINFDDNGNAEIISKGGAYLRYNATSGQERFRYFKSTTYQNQKAIQLYQLVDTSDPSVTVDITSVGYATLYYSDKDLIVPKGVEAQFYYVEGGELVKIEPTFTSGSTIPKGFGAVLKATSPITKTRSFKFREDMTIHLWNSEVYNKWKKNLLLGLDEDGTTVGPDGTTDDYIFYMLSTDKNGENVGFYWKNGGAPFTTMGHKAYLAIPKSSNVNVSSFVFDDLTGIRAITENTSEDTKGVYTLSGIRVNASQLPKGIYIVNGKKVVIK